MARLSRSCLDRHVLAGHGDRVAFYWRGEEGEEREPMAAEHPLFLLCSSGSTGKPKGILHTTGGYLTGVTTTMAMVFDLDVDRDVLWCTADVAGSPATPTSCTGPWPTAARR